MSSLPRVSRTLLAVMPVIDSKKPPRASERLVQKGCLCLLQLLGGVGVVSSLYILPLLLEFSVYSCLGAFALAGPL